MQQAGEFELCVNHTSECLSCLGLNQTFTHTAGQVGGEGSGFVHAVEHWSD